MRNVCRDCNRKFPVDLRYCPKCGGIARPPKSSSWHHKEGGMVFHMPALSDDESAEYRRNAWVLLCSAIILVPEWLFALRDQMGEPSPWDLGSDLLLSLGWVTGTLLVVLAGIAYAYRAERPGAQVLAAWVVVLYTASLSIWVFLPLGFLFCVVWGLGSGRTKEFARPDATYMMLLSGIALLSIVLVAFWRFIPSLGL